MEGPRATLSSATAGIRACASGAAGRSGREDGELSVPEEALLPEPIPGTMASAARIKGRSPAACSGAVAAIADGLAAPGENRPEGGAG